MKKILLLSVLCFSAQGMENPAGVVAVNSSVRAMSEQLSIVGRTFCQQQARCNASGDPVEPATDRPIYTTEKEKALLSKIDELSQTMERLKAESVRFPDYSRGVVKKAYDATVSGEFTAEENGWVFISAYSLSVWIHMVINGKDVCGNGGQGGFYGTGSGCHASFFYPVKRGDTYKAVGGSYHTVVFYPCI